eukprot:TRINITY_DN17735_c0_g1_i5.p2 TRINITY_DN17735_c0_g1~~TRINITY_DN17735_c0_g1_i5.p2  ORF type:complete len:301 (+),score=137.63 TRINITY_DN17735_c0_g1_i5:52-954(+)
MALSRQVLSDITFRSLNINSPRAEKGYIVPKAAKPRDLCCRVLDFVDDILDNLHREEGHTLIHQNHLAICQVEVTDKMRAILVDWLVDVHLKYKCRPETMYLAVNILDRYLMCQPVEKKKLQLVGCVAMMLAAKYEEVMPPEVRDFVHISANTYTRTEMLQMEKGVLVELDYGLTVPTLWQFLTQLTQLEGTDDTMRYSAEYLAEQTLMCGKLCGFAPSMQAAACVLLSRRVLGVSNVWTDELQETSRYYESDLYEIAELLDEHMKRVPKLRVAAVRKKYSHSRYGCVSRTFDAHAELHN